MWDAMWSWAKDNNVAPAIVSGAFTFMTATLGLFVLWIQLRAQRNNLTRQLKTQQDLLVKQLETQADNTARSNRDLEGVKLKKDIYLEVGKVTKSALSELQSAATYVFLYANQFKGATARSNVLPRIQYREFGDRHIKATRETTEVRDTIVRWHIIDARMRVFEFAIDSRLFDLTNVYSKYSEVAAYCALIKPGEEDEDPNAERIVKLDNFTLPLLQAYSLLRFAIEDYQRELQVVTLSELFKDARVVKREFIGPLNKAISLNESDWWVRYFKEETPWGKQQVKPAQFP